MFVGDAATPPCDGTCRLADHGEGWPDVALVSAAPPPSEALDDLRWHTCLGCRGCCPYPETVGVEGLWIEASSLELAAKQIPEMQLGEPFPGCQTEQRFCMGVVRRPVVEVFGHGCVRASGSFEPWEDNKLAFAGLVCFRLLEVEMKGFGGPPQVSECGRR